MGAFLVMDYVEGDTLAGLQRAGLARSEPVPARIGLRILLDALAGLHAAHRIGRAERRMLGELRHELRVAARVLHLVLHASRAGAIGLGDLGHALFGDLRRGARGLVGELLALVGRRAVTAAGDDER